jgi:type II secretory ATPase GspE/PulE/Tfp pilus assembly ATPase PilB-like protein
MDAPAEEPQHFVEKMLGQAMDEKASDVYWIPGAETLNIRFRVDGIQRDIATVPREYADKCVARIKVLAGLLTYRTRISQDGVIRDPGTATSSELRVAVMPTSHGERVSIRLLQGETGPLFLEDLGFPDSVVAALRGMLARPSGMIVLTGPTGCGKTTTIYSLIRELLREQQDPASIITIEDPIESQIKGISQVSVSGDPGWGYAAALRSALRQDVKTIVVGEMRDREIVGVTLDAALTGHRVITTYHAGDIPSVYARMLHQGFEPFLISSAVTGVVSQRLVQCRDKSGRVPVVAVLAPDDEWRDFITATPGLTTLRKKIRQYPAADLARVSREMVKQGLISEHNRQLPDMDNEL